MKQQNNNNSHISLWIAILGSDGSGKSTVINQVTQNLSSYFLKIAYIHLRPKLGMEVDKNTIPVTNPHSLKPHAWFISTVKIFYFLFDYSIGYLLKIRPLLFQSIFVIFDRYYHDILVDPKRYRYGGSMRLARWIGKLIPKPGIVILLDAPPEVLQSRKQEVPFEETARQRLAYLDLVKEMKNGVVIDASQPLDKVVADTNKVILDYMAKRTKKHVGF
jgi:thymidylate kinase